MTRSVPWPALGRARGVRGEREDTRPEGGARSASGRVLASYSRRRPSVVFGQGKSKKKKEKRCILWWTVEGVRYGQWNRSAVILRDAGAITGRGGGAIPITVSGKGRGGFGRFGSTGEFRSPWKRDLWAVGWSDGQLHDQCVRSGGRGLPDVPSVPDLWSVRESLDSALPDAVLPSPASDHVDYDRGDGYEY